MCSCVDPDATAMLKSSLGNSGKVLWLLLLPDSLRAGSLVTTMHSQNATACPEHQQQIVKRSKKGLKWWCNSHILRASSLKLCRYHDILNVGLYLMTCSLTPRAIFHSWEVLEGHPSVPRVDLRQCVIISIKIDIITIYILWLSVVLIQYHGGIQWHITLCSSYDIILDIKILITLLA